MSHPLNAVLPVSVVRISVARLRREPVYLSDRMSKPDLTMRTRLAMSELLDRVLGSVAPRHSAVPSRVLDLSELEERILLSASPAVVAAELVEPVTAEMTLDESAVITTEDAAQTESQGSASQRSAPSLSTDPAQNVSREIVFLDTSVQDYQQLLDDLWANDDPSREIEVVLLSGSRDGIGQITDSLHGRHDLDAIHIVSHGTDAAVKLGSTWLTQENMAGYVGQISRWGSALSADADLLFYGCDLAASSEGRDLIDTFAALTGADTAASDDDTGSAIFGGDWDLEYAIGRVDANIAFSQSAQNEWSGLLNTFVVTTTADGGAGSLRQAIIDANALAGADTITIGAGTYTLTIDGDNEAAAATGDLDITEDLTIQGAGADVTILDGGGLERYFDVISGSVTISGVTIQNGDLTQGAGDSGGAINVRSGATAIVSDAVLQNNIADAGGAIDVSGTLTLTDVTIDGNTADNSAGGGIQIGSTGSAVLTRVTISNNSALGGNDGGGIDHDGTSLVMTNVTISGNTATNRGGGLNLNGTTTLQNVTITNNSATGRAGGVEVNGGSTVTTRNTLIAGNTAPTAADLNGTISSLGNNLIGDSADGGGFVGSDILDVSPTLGALSSYGGTTKTHALLTGSRGIDEGSATGAPSTDQRSLNRDTTPDIGAFEYFSSTTLSLQEGVDGYSGTQDTQLDAVSHNVVFGAETTLNVDRDTSGADGDQPAQGLIRFDNLFGNGAGQIPLGSIITSATLTFETTGTSTGDFQLHRMLTSWDESTATWDSFVGGLDSGSEYAASSDSTLSSPSTTGPHDFTGLVDTLQLWSDGSTNNGWAILADSSNGWDFASSENTTTSFRPQLSVEFVAAPVVTLPGAAVSYTENDPATIIDGSATVSDVDSADFNTGTLTVDFTVNGTANDRLAIRNQGTGVGQIGVSGSNVTYEGTTIATFTGGTDGSTPLVITFNASSSPTAAQALARNITYENVSENPSELARTVRFVVTDGDGGTSTAVTQTVNVTAENDAPTISDIAHQSTHTDTATSAISFTVGDIETAAASLTVTGTSSNTALVPNANVVIGGSGANRTVTITPAAGQTGTTTITITVDDGTTTTNDTFTLSVTDPAQRVLSGTATIAAGASSASATIAPVHLGKSFLVFSSTVSDSDPADTQIRGQLTSPTTVEFHREGTGPEVSIKWTVVEYASGVSVQRGTLDSFSTTSANIALSAIDTTKSVPLVSMSIPGTIHSEDDFVQSRITSSTNLELTRVGSNSTGTVDWQVIEFDNSIVKSGDVSFLTGDASKTVTIPAVNTGKSWLVYNFKSPDGTIAHIGQKLIRGVITDATTLTFDRDVTGQALDLTWYLVEFTDDTAVQHGSESFGTTDTQRDVTISGVDTNKSFAVGGAFQRGGKSGYTADDDPGVGWTTLELTSASNLQITRSQTGSVTADIGWSVVQIPNVVPTVTLPGTAVSYTENDPATVIDATATVADVDSADFDSGTLTIDFQTNGTANDRLTIRNQGTGAGQIGVSGSDVTYEGTTIGTFTGGTDGSTPLVITFNANSTQAAAQALARNITYENVSEYPSELARTVRFVITDGDGGTSTAVTQTVNVAEVNDDPVITSNGGGATAAFNIAEGGEIATTVTVNDPDVPGQTIAYSIIGGADAAAFSIDNATGELTFVDRPDWEAPADADANNVYQVTVRAFDGTVADTQDLSITIENRRYIERNATFAATTANTWEVVDLSAGAFDIPAGVAVEIGITTSNLNDQRFGGVREFGSTIERRIDIDNIGGSGEGMGYTILTTQTDGSSRIEVYSEDPGSVTFTVLGYWESGRFVERYDTITLGTANTWVDQDLSSFGVGADQVAEIAVRNNVFASARQGGVRADGSTLERRIDMHPTGFGGEISSTFLVQASSAPTATVELFAENTGNIEFRLLGYWDETPGTFNETFTDLGLPAASATWEALDLTAQGVSGNDVANIMFLNRNNSETAAEFGVRTNESNTDRINDIRHASTNGGVSAFSTHVNTDSNGNIEWYRENVGGPHTIYLTGYWSNQAPVLTASSSTASYTENAAPIFDASATVTDADSTNFHGGTLTVSLVTNGTANDRLGIRNVETGAGQISTSGATVSYEGTAIGTFTGGTDGSTPLVVTLNEDANQPAVQALARAVTYNNVSEDPSTATRTLRAVLTDGDGGTSANSDIAITVISENDAPTVSTTGSTLSYTENDAATVIDNGLTVADVDDTTLSSATVSISTGFQFGADRLAFTNQLGITGSYNAETGILSLTGSASVADYQTAMRTVTYENTSDNPSTTTRTVSFFVDDGVDSSTAGTRNISITAQNDAPVATADPGAYEAELLAQNPLSYWRLGETSGTTAIDDGTLENPGTYNGTTQGQTGAIANDSDPATRFNGTSDYVEFAHNAAYLLDNGTIQLWFNADAASTGTEQHLFSKDSNGFDTGGHISVYLTTAGRVEARLQSTTTNYFVQTASSVSSGAWHHVAVTFGNDGLQLFVDGELADIEAYTGGLGTTSGGTGNANPIAIGAGTQSSGDNVITPVDEFFAGLIDEVAILGSQLSAETIQDIYAAGVQNYSVNAGDTLSVPVGQGVLTNDFDPDGDSLTTRLISGPSNGTLLLNPTGPAFDTNLTNDAGADKDPDWSADGSKIAFRSNRDGNDEIYVMNADGTGQMRLTTDAAGDNQPAWSPDGTKIAFVSTRDGNSEIYVMDADGSNQTRLTTEAANDTRPIWSPDGTQIAFRSLRDGIEQIYIMDADGSNQTRLVTTASNDTPEDFTPDGSQILFSSDRDGNDELYIMDIDGSNVVRLTNNAASDTGGDLSPDGSKITFRSDRDGDFEIFMMDVDGSNVVQLTSNTATEGSPTWSPDGSEVIYHSNQTGDFEIFSTELQSDGAFTYIPDSGFSGTDTFTYVANDGTTDSNTQTVTITVNNANTAPDVTLPGAALSYAEGDAATVIDATATITDSDSPDFDAGTLTIDFTANGTANDRLAIQNEGTGAGQIGVSGSNVTYEGTTIGTFTGGSDGSTPLVVTLNANATQTAVQSLARHITYENVATDPDTDVRTVRFVLTDGDGGTSSAATQTINVAGDNILVVNTTSNTADGDASSIDALLANRGADGRISLHEAIEAANNTANGTSADEIHFEILDALVGGVHTISVTGSGLPTILEELVIDGTTDADYAGSPVIVLDGNGVTGTVNGLTLTGTSDGSVIRGLAINRFSGDGIQIQSGADNVTIAGNWIGSDGTGSPLAGNGDDGIDIRGASATIGGLGANDGNVINNAADEGITIASTGTGAMLFGNIIGLEADGSSGTGNADVGIAVFADNTTIGGTTTAHRNVISNNFEGIEINTDNNIVQGNYIGTDATGSLARGNSSDDGIEIQSGGSNNTIGGRGVGEGNVIAFNGGDGVFIASGTGNTVVGNQMFSNTGLGIDLGTNGVTANDTNILDADSGSNNLQNYPVITRAVATGDGVFVSGRIDSAASATFTLDFYSSAAADASGFGEGTEYLTSVDVTTDVAGHGNFRVRLAAANLNDFISATATDASGNTSEFGQSVQVAAATPSIWVSFDGTGEAPNHGLEAFAESEVFELGDPNLLLGNPEAGTDNGTFAQLFDIADFINSGITNVYGLHYVTADIDIAPAGTTPVSLLAGDVLLAVKANGVLTNADMSTTAVTNEDIILFRPTTLGDYSSGTFSVVLDQFTDAQVRSLSLVESDTVVGDTTLSRGSFLFTQNNGATRHEEAIYVFTPTDAGVNTAGTFELLIDGLEATSQIDKRISGLELIENATTVGGASLTTGQILVTTANNTNVGQNLQSVEERDIFVLTVTETSIDGDSDGLPSTATAELLVDGSDLELDGGAEGLESIALIAEPTNASPTISTPGSAVAYTENDPATIIDGTATVTDVDSADLDSGTLTVEFSANGSGNDRLAIRNQGTGAGQIGVSGSDVSYAGTVIGTFTGGTNGATPLVVTFNASSTPTAAQALIRNITYENVSDAPSTLARTVRFILNDGDGGVSNATTQTINVTAVNDNPVVTLPGAAVNYTENDPATIVDATATVTDVDSADFDGGTLQAGFAGATGTANDTLAIRNQGTGAGQIGISGSNVAYEGTIIGTFSGGTGGSQLSVSLNASATPTAVQALARNITYENSSNDPDTTTRLVRIDVMDGDGGDSANVNQSINFTTVNDAPVLDLNGSDGGGINFSTTFTEGDAPVNVTDTDATLADVDHTAFQSLAISLTGFSDGSVEELTVAGNQFQAGVSDTKALTVGATTFSVAFDGSDFTITRDGGGNIPQADLQSLIRGITYEHKDDNPTAGNRTLTFTLRDAGGLDSAAAVSSIGVGVVNDAPIITSNGGGDSAAVNVDENSTAVTTVTSSDIDGAAPVYSIIGGADAARFQMDSNSGALSFIIAPDRENATDANSDHVYEVAVQVSDQNGGFDSQTISVTVNDLDEFDVTSPADSDATDNAVDENAANGTTVGITATAADADATSNAVTYSLTDNAGGRFAIDASSGVVTVADGTLLDRETAASHNITVRATSEDGSTADSSFTININDLDEFDVTSPADSDATDNAVDENAANGTTVGITASAADADATSNAVTYSLTDNAAGRFAIDASSGVVTVADGTLLDRETAASHNITVRATSEDGSTQDSIFTVTVNDQNDNAPVVTPGQSFNVSEFATNGTPIGTATATDADQVGSLQGWAITSGNEEGVFEINAATGEIRVVDNAQLNFETTAGYGLGLTVQDGTNTSTSQTVTINVVDENDVPVLVTNSGQSVVEGASVTISDSELAVTDEDALPGQIQYSVDSGPSSGRLELTTDPGLAISSFTQADINAGRLRYVHDGSELDDSFTFSVSDGSGGTIAPATFSIATLQVNDAPVNAVPAAQSVNEDSSLTFSSAGGNAITVSDVDLNGGLIGVQLVATEGVLTLGSTVGLTFASGDGTDDPSMVFAGTIDDVNTALDGLRFDPTENFHGPASVRIVSRDMGSTGSGGEQIDDDTISITVLPVNDAPVAVDDDFALNEDEALSVIAVDGLLANDSDVDLDSLSVIQVTSVSNGTLLLNSDGSFTYTPDSGFSGTDSFTYRASDGTLQSQIRTVTLEVSSVNDAPVTVDDEYTIDQLEVLALDAASGVLVNDIDADFDSLQAILVDGPQNGQLTLNSDGSLTYTPNGTFFGQDTFTYLANDGSANSPVATVRILVRQTISVTTTPVESQTETDSSNSETVVEEVTSDSTESPANNSDGAVAAVSTINESVDLTAIQQLTAVPADSVATESETADDSAAESEEGLESEFQNSSMIAEMTLQTEDRIDSRDRSAMQAFDALGTSVFTSSDVGSMVYVLEQTGFWSELDTFEQDVQSSMLEQGEWEDLVVETTTVAGTTLTVGYIVWLLRSGSVVFGLISSLPAWTMMDPLPVLESGLENLTGSEDDDDDSLQAILETHQGGLDMHQETFET